MCGIAGLVGGDPRDARARLGGMLERMVQRGPDGRGEATGGSARLGCVRLTIRGGDAGHQPLRTRTGLLVFNGEIYNVPELVKELDSHGVKLDGASDTQVVGALIDLHGPGAVHRLNGMYALAFDDGRRVWMARDPVGQKPLYYTCGDGEGAFASTIGALLGRRRSVHGPALARWLLVHYAWGTETLFTGVLRVPPGGIVELPSGRVEQAADAALRFGAPNPAHTEERLRKVLERGVRDALPAGERCAVTLSGGVDSTLVAALAAAAGARPTAFHGHVAAEGCDESGYARTAAKELGLPLTEVPVTERACREALPAVVRALEEPVAGPGSLAQWVVARSIAEHGTRIVLSGCGGDELFGGYARAAALTRDEPPPGLEAYAPLFERVRGLAPGPRALALLDRRSAELYTQDFLEAHPAPVDAVRQEFELGGPDPLAGAARLELAITLPALLQVEDRVTMAFSLEGRVPLLDRRLLRVAARLGPEARVAPDGTLKALLRRAAAPYLPAPVAARRDKLGFTLPLGEWLRGPWRELVRDVLLDPRTRQRGILDAAAVEATLSAPSLPYNRGLWSALFLELWHRTFIDSTD